MIKLLSRKPTALRLVNPSAAKIKIFRSEERFSRNAETDLVCRLLLEKKNHHAAPTYVAHMVIHGGTGSGHPGQLHTDVPHVPVGHWQGHDVRTTSRTQAEALAVSLHT